jgi:hypothetical protein
MPQSLQIAESTGKIDKRTKNGKKLDLSKLIELREVNGLPFEKIGKILNYDHTYLWRQYEKFKDVIQPSEITKSYSNNRIKILNSLELNMLHDLANEGKREKASLNNVAYAFNQIHTARRLEEGKGVAGGITISIEVAYQDATNQAKALRLQHAGSSKVIEHEPDD